MNFRLVPDTCAKHLMYALNTWLTRIHWQKKSPDNAQGLNVLCHGLKRKGYAPALSLVYPRASNTAPFFLRLTYRNALHYLSSPTLATP